MKRIVLLASIVVAGCGDPGWEIKNPASAPNAVDASCVEAGVRAWSPDVKTNASIHREWVELQVRTPATTPYAVHVLWRERTPNQLELSVYDLGMQAPCDVLAGFRSVRDDIVAHVAASCGTAVTLGPEWCQRCK